MPDYLSLALAGGLLLQGWLWSRSLLSEREAGERRLTAQQQAHEHTLQYLHTTHEKMLDRLQARYLAEFKAAQVAPVFAPEPDPEPVDSDWEAPTFSRPPLGIETED